jgi:hypothetical protein
MMNVTYFEYYPHYLGTMSSRVTMSDIALGALFLVQQEQADDMFNSICEELEKECSCTLYFLSSAITNDGMSDRKKDNARFAKRVYQSLTDKGFFVGEVEEGSYYFALAGSETKARAALFNIEAGHLADEEFGE